MVTTERARWQLGCQARPWIQTLGIPDFRERLPDVMQQIAGIGFAGFETALPALPLDDPNDFAHWREAANGIQLAAAHTGGSWWEPDAAAQVEKTLGMVAKLPALQCARLMVSIGAGVTELDGAGLDRLVTTLGRLGAGAAEHGVQVSIHNHAHELRDDARVLRAIVDGTDATHVSLGADIGWVVAGGWDAVAFIETFGDRLGYLHVRDVRTDGNRVGFVEVGRGSMAWPAIVERLSAGGFNGWLTAESEFTDDWFGLEDPLETATAQFRGMTQHLA